MKQKRKVKSLLPQKKDWRSSLLTAVLLILSVALCIGSASLITSTVRAAEPGVIGTFTYTGLDEEQEVLYGMRFIDPSNMSREVNNMYIKGKSFYITPNPVIVNPILVGSDVINTEDNKVEGGVYGHVLGGDRNIVKSDNVTLIAGENNVVTPGNGDAAFLGGRSNSGFGSMEAGGTPMVVVGGSNNTVGENHNGVALIGGNSNKIGDNVSNAFILGGEENEIEAGRSNIIIGGKKVKVRSAFDVNNIFVYSNKDINFEPESSNAFYLNVDAGVGINTTPSNRGMAVAGVISLGIVDIDTVPCDNLHPDNLGVEGKYNNCVVGCTKAGQAVGKWEMLDRGETCQSVCAGKPGSCIYTGEKLEPADPYGAYCTTADFTGHSHMCYEDELEDFESVVFETSLIDSETECPENNENKCIYQCDEGYRLTGNVAGGSSTTYRCYKDCEYTWANGDKVIYKHNETVIGYNVETVSCSNDIYVFPFGTEIIKKGLPALTPAGLSVGNKIANGETYRNRATNGYSPETCVNYEHKKTLVCNNGTMYLTMDNDGKRANTSLKARDKGYIYRDCDTVSYTCNINPGEYQYSQTQIKKPFSEGGLQDSGDEWENKNDRQEFKLLRGKYKLCLDYNKVDGHNDVCNVVDNNNPHEVHYKFIECNKSQGYYPYPREDSHECYKQCSVVADNGKTITLKHKEIREFYQKNTETCTGVCVGQKFMCEDGTFYSTGLDHMRREDPNNTFKNSECRLNEFRCNQGEYNVSQSEYDRWSDKGHYVSCDDYDPDPSNGKNAKACVKKDRRYKLDYCYEGYHTEDMRQCIDNVHLENCEKPKTDPAHWYWVRSSGPVQTYPWSNIITSYISYVGEGKFFKRWNESCRWNDPADSCWTDELQTVNNGKVIPGDACKWECEKSYVKNANRDGCRYIETTCKYPDDDMYACVNTEPYDCGDDEADIIDKGVGAGEGEWRWKCYNGVRSDSCLLCKDGYHKEVNSSGVEVCVKNENAKCGTTHWNCVPGKNDDKNENDAKWYWNCLALDSEGYGCTQSIDVEGCYECKPGYHKTATDGECEEDTAKLYYHDNGKSSAVLPSPNPDIMRYTKQTLAANMDNIEGYKFVKWCTTSDGQGGTCYNAGKEIKKAKVSPTQDIHLYAIWKENTATLTYDESACGGSSWTQTMKYSEETEVSSPKNISDCYSFDRWCDQWGWNCHDAGDILKYAYDEPEDITLYAECTRKTYTITYNADGGTPTPSSQTVSCGENEILADKITKDYYEFYGWKSSVDGSMYAAKANYGPVKQNVTMTAQWTNTALLTYDACGHGSAPMPVTLYYATQAKAANAVTADGYTFLDWCPEGCDYVGGGCYQPGDVVKDANVNPTNIHLYARWQQNGYTCKETHYGCNGVTATNPSDSDTTKWTWDCGATHCYECKTGYHKDDDGECVPDATSCPTGTVDDPDKCPDGFDVEKVPSIDCWTCTCPGETFPTSQDATAYVTEMTQEGCDDCNIRAYNGGYCAWCDSCNCPLNNRYWSATYEHIPADQPTLYSYGDECPGGDYGTPSNYSCSKIGQFCHLSNIGSPSYVKRYTCGCYSVCNTENRSNIRSKQEFCYKGTESNVELIWEPAGGGSYYAPKWTWDCTFGGTTVHCAKTPYFVWMFDPYHNNGSITDRFQYQGVDSSKILNSGIKYLFHEGGRCVYKDGYENNPWEALDFPANIQKIINSSEGISPEVNSSFSDPLDFCGWHVWTLNHNIAGWAKSDLDYLVIPDGDTDIGIITDRYYGINYN